MTTLEGTRVVVTRSSDDSDPLAQALEELGANVLRLPTIAIEIPDELIAAAAPLPEELLAVEYEWIVFSSRPGVQAFARLIQSGDHVDVFGRVHVAAVGTATVDAFEQLMGRAVDLVPKRFTGRDVADAIGTGEGRVLLIRPEDAPRSIVEELRGRGWDTTEVPLYRTVRGDPSPEAVEQVKGGGFDIVTFTSGSTVRFFTEIVGDLSFAEHHRVVVIGPSTEGVARELGIRVDSVADPHTTQGVVDAVARLVGR